MAKNTSLMKDVDARQLVKTYLYLNPELCQADIAARLNVSPMVVSRWMNSVNKPDRKFDAVFEEMLVELYEMGLDKHIEELCGLAEACRKAANGNRIRTARDIVFKSLLLPVCRDFEERNSSSYAFNYYSSERKLSWVVVDAKKVLLACPAVKGFIYPKRDAVILFTDNQNDFDEATYRYHRISWDENSVMMMGKNQSHSIVLVNTETESIEEVRVLR